MIVDPSDIVGRNRRQENSNAMLSEGEVNMGMVGIDSIHVEPEWFLVVFLCFSTAKSKKNKKIEQVQDKHAPTTVLVRYTYKIYVVCVHAVW